MLVLPLASRSFRAIYVQGGYPWKLSWEQRWALALDDFAQTLRRCA